MPSTLRVKSRYYEAGEALKDWPRKLAREGHAESPLARKQPFWRWWAQQEQVLDAPEGHWKVTIWDRTEVVGGIVLVTTMDAQVGRCMVAYHQFLMPAYRGSSRVWREAIQEALACARAEHHKYLVWTHRQGSIFKYTYKEV